MPQFVHAPAIGPLLLAVLLPGTATATALLPAPGFGSRLTLSSAGERQGAADGVDGVERDDFDVVLGYVFEASEATVPINFIKLPDGQPENNCPRLSPYAERRTNYSVFGACADLCKEFQPWSQHDSRPMERQWNGTQCDAWTTTVNNRGDARATFECTLYQFADVDKGPAVPVDMPCSGCATGIIHTTWAENDVYTVIFCFIFGMHLLHLCTICWEHGEHGELREYVLMTVETFVPMYFAVTEMAASACSITHDFVSVLLVWLVFAGGPEKLSCKTKIAVSVASEKLFEALSHARPGGHGGGPGWEQRQRQSINDQNDIYEDDDRLLESGWVAPDFTEIDRLRAVVAEAEETADSFEPIYQYHRGINGYILIHLFRIVKKQQARKNAAL